MLLIFYSPKNLQVSYPLEGSFFAISIQFDTVKELLKAVPPEDPESTELDNVLKKILEVVDYINERKRRAESKIKLAEIQLRLDDSIAAVSCLFDDNHSSLEF